MDYPTQINTKINIRDKLKSMWLYIKKNLLYHKKHILIACIICFCVSFLCAGGLAFCDYTYSNATGIPKTVINWVDDIFGTHGLDSIKSILNVQLDGNSSISVGGISLSGIMPTIKSIYNIFKGIGFFLATLYFFAGIFEFIINVKDDSEIFFGVIKKLMFYIIAVALLQNAMDIIFFVANLGAAIVDKIGVVISDNPITYDDLKQYIYDNTHTTEGKHGTKYLSALVTDIATGVGFVLQLLIPWLFSKIAFIGVQFSCWKRFIELLLVAIYSPVSFADITKGHFEHSDAVKTIKNVIAISFSGATIFLTCWLCTQIQGQLVQGSVGEDFLGATWNCVIISLVQLGLVSKSTEITKQALGMA